MTNSRSKYLAVHLVTYYILLSLLLSKIIIYLNSKSGYSQYQARLAIFKSRILDCMKTDNFIEQFYDDMSSLLTGVSGSIFYDEIRRKYALPPAIFGKFI